MKAHQFKYALLIACSITALVMSYFWYSYIHERSSVTNAAWTTAEQDTLQAAQSVEKLTQELKTKVEALADYVSKHKVTQEDIAKLLAQKTSNMGLGIAFAPYAFDSKQQLYAPYFVESAGKDYLVQLESVYDYTKTTRYKEPAEQGARYSVSYLDKATNTIIIEYGMPFFDQKGVLQGVVFGTYKAPDIKNVLIDNLNASKKGLVSIIARNGVYVYHPNRNFMLSFKSALELEKGDPVIKKIVSYVAKEKAGFLEGEHLATNRPAWFFYVPIKNTPWTLVATFIKDDLGLFPDSEKHELIKAVLTTLLLFIFMCVLCAGSYFGLLRALWISSVCIAFSFLVGVTFVWYLASHGHNIEKTQDVLIDSEPVMNNFVATLEAKLKEVHGGLGFIGKKIPVTLSGDKKAEVQANNTLQTNSAKEIFSITQAYNDALDQGTLKKIPTGIYISEVEFNPLLGVNKVKVAGVVWQRYKNGLHDNIARGVVFPDALSMETEQINKSILYDDELIIWRFSGTIIQSFNSKNYPFDDKNINMRIWSQDFKNPVLLTPDLDAYKLLTPSVLPQVSTEIRATLPEWYFERSYFSFRDHLYLTSFGYYSTEAIESAGKSESVELVVNITLKRFISGILMLNIIPILTILLLLYLVLVMSGLGILKFEHVLASIASLFFTSILAYNRFYTDVPVEYSIFLGSFYHMVEITLFIVALITVAYFLRFKLSFLTSHNMIVPQLLYWPLITGWSLLQSLMYFY